MLDISFENVAYNQKDERTFFIDAENLVLADKQHIQMTNGNWNETFYISEFDNCDGMPDCLKYDVEEMCNKYHVDINFYSGN